MEEKIKNVKEFLNNRIEKSAIVNPKPKRPCIMIFEGKRVRLMSGKNVWSSKGAARTAFSNAVNHITGYRQTKEVREALEEEGTLIFKEL